MSSEDLRSAPLSRRASATATPTCALGLVLCALAFGCSRQMPKEMKPADRANGLYLRGSAEFLQGNLKKSLRDFEEVKKLTPKDPRLPVALGEVYLAQGNLKKAAASFNLAAERNPKRAETWARIGRIDLLQGKLEPAKDALLKALSLAPNDYFALEALGDLALKQKDAPEAARQYALAADLQPDPSERTRLWMEGVDALEKAHRPKDALAYLHQATSRGEHAPEVEGELGRLLVASGDFSGAEKAYQAAARSGSKNPAYWQLVGELDLRLKKPEAARDAFRESLRVEDRSVVHVALGRIALSRGNQQEAERQLSAALKVADGDNPYEAPELADLMVRLGQQKNALTLLKEASAEPDHATDVELQRKTAKLALALGQKSLVAQVCARVVKAGDHAACP